MSDDGTKLRHWLNEGPSTYWALHMFELGLIVSALDHFQKSFELNPIAQEVYDHLKEVIESSELPHVLPTPETLDRYMRDGGKYVKPSKQPQTRGRRQIKATELWEDDEE